MQLVLLATALSVAAASNGCESFCSSPCTELNGSPENECGGCEAPMLCRPGAEGFDGSHIKRDAAAMGARDAAATAARGAAAQLYTSHGNNPVQLPSGYVDTFEVGACDLEVVDAADVTRERLVSAEAPLIIKGLTSRWAAHARWDLDALLTAHGDEPFHLHAAGNASLRELLALRGKYSMGHAVWPPSGCYSDPYRPYSPVLYGALADDYSLPDYFYPMKTFQMGLGVGVGVGVPPENHPSSWFAMIKGRKRWVLNPPSAGSAESGGSGTQPPAWLQRRSAKCVPAQKPLGALHCDQAEGDIIWLPHMWWHETCGLDGYSIGIGGLTVEGCCEEAAAREEEAKYASGWPRCGEPGGYRIAEIEACAANELRCGTLPINQSAR